MNFRVKEIQNKWGSLAGAERGLTGASPERLVVLFNILFSFLKREAEANGNLARLLSVVGGKTEPESRMMLLAQR